MAAKIEAGLIRTAEQLEAADFKLAEAKSRMNKLLEKPLERSDPKQPQTAKEIANLRKMITALEDGRANQAAAKKTMNQVLQAAIEHLDPELYSEASLVENAEKVKALRQMIAQEPKEALQLMRYLQEGNDPRNIRKFMSELANGKSCPKDLAAIQALAKSASVNLARIAF
jgi:hypothetical protein